MQRGRGRGYMCNIFLHLKCEHEPRENGVPFMKLCSSITFSLLFSSSSFRSERENVCACIYVCTYVCMCVFLHQYVYMCYPLIRLPTGQLQYIPNVLLLSEVYLKTRSTLTLYFPYLQKLQSVSSEIFPFFICVFIFSLSLYFPLQTAWIISDNRCFSIQCLKLHCCLLAFFLYFTKFERKTKEFFFMVLFLRQEINMIYDLVNKIQMFYFSFLQSCIVCQI